MPTIVDFNQTLESKDIEQVQVYIDTLDISKIDTEIQCQLLKTALQKRNVPLFSILLDKFSELFLAKDTGELLSISIIEQILEKSWTSSQSERFEFIDLLMLKKISPRLFLKTAVQAIYDAEIFSDLYQKILQEYDPKYYFTAMLEALNVGNNNAIEIILKSHPGNTQKKVQHFLALFKDCFRTCSPPTQLGIVCFSARYQFYEDFEVYWKQMGRLSEEQTLEVVKSCTKLSWQDFEKKLWLILRSGNQGYNFLHYLALVIDEIPKEWLPELFAKYKNNFDQQNRLGKTILHLLCERCNAHSQADYLEFIETVLKMGASPNIFDQEDCAPLHIAIRNKNLALMRLLIKHHANPTLQNRKHSSSAIEIALQEKDNNLKSTMLTILRQTSVRKRKESLPMSTYREISSLVEFTVIQQEPKRYRKICLERQPHSILAELIHTIVKDDEINFYRIMTETMKFLTDSDFSDLLVKIVDLARYNMLVFVLKNASQHLAKNAIGSSILCRAIKVVYA